MENEKTWGLEVLKLYLRLHWTFRVHWERKAEIPLYSVKKVTKINNYGYPGAASTDLCHMSVCHVFSLSCSEVSLTRITKQHQALSEPGLASKKCFVCLLTCFLELKKWWGRKWVQSTQNVKTGELKALVTVRFYKTTSKFLAFFGGVYSAITSPACLPTA